jgi:hypothetical protein
VRNIWRLKTPQRGGQLSRGAEPGQGRIESRTLGLLEDEDEDVPFESENEDGAE